MRFWFRLLLGAVALTGVVSAALVVNWLFSPPGAIGQPSCIEAMPLTPVEEPGWWWERHRYSLALPAAELDGAGALVLWNQRTDDLFNVDPDTDLESQDGWLYFNVHTRYAVVVNRSWRSDPWVLCVVSTAPDFT